MQENPFQIIKPDEEPPKELKKEVMGNVKSLVFVLRFVQLFLGDYGHAIFQLMKTGKNKKQSKDESKNNN